jgi:diguanylate cyclase (GGDEF)-like protein
MPTPANKKTVPARALAISLAALLAPVAAVVIAPDWASTDIGMLIWLSALIPAFLLSFYRGYRGVAIALSGGMAVITATQVSVAIFEIAEPNWRLLGLIVGVYLVVSIGIAGLSEALRRERSAAEEMALVDSLTLLPNRRHAEVVLRSEFAGAERGRGLAVVIFDLDRFKLVNDRHGHPAGDLTLRTFAKLLGETTRTENLSARFGGEEFVSILREATPEDAVLFAQRVLDRMRSYPLPWGRQTVSAGVAVYEKGMGSFELLIAAADRALYKAKSDGRDMVCVAPSSGDVAPSRPRRVSTKQMRAIVEGEEFAPPADGVASVYIVDDDAAIRSVLRRILARRGYELWDTGEPRDAITRFRNATQAERPDVILTDVIMPSMSGMRMIDQIAEIEPALRVIYMSGHVQSKIDWPRTPGAMVSFLAKPITPEALLGAMEAMISQMPAPPAAGA